METILNDANFEAEVLKSDKPVFVDFWAPWCGPCQMTGPFVHAISEEMKDSNVKICKMNVDESPNTAGTYNVMSIPTFMMFKGGAPVDQIVGGVQKEKMEEMIKRHL